MFFSRPGSAESIESELPFTDIAVIPTESRHHNNSDDLDPRYNQKLTFRIPSTVHQNFIDATCSSDSSFTNDKSIQIEERIPWKLIPIQVDNPVHHNFKLHGPLSEISSDTTEDKLNDTIDQLAEQLKENTGASFLLIPNSETDISSTAQPYPPWNTNSGLKMHQPNCAGFQTLQLSSVNDEKNILSSFVEGSTSSEAAVSNSQGKQLSVHLQPVLSPVGSSLKDTITEKKDSFVADVLSPCFVEQNIEVDSPNVHKDLLGHSSVPDKSETGKVNNILPQSLFVSLPNIVESCPKCQTIFDLKKITVNLKNQSVVVFCNNCHTTVQMEQAYKIKR